MGSCRFHLLIIPSLLLLLHPAAWSTEPEAPERAEYSDELASPHIAVERTEGSDREEPREGTGNSEEPTVSAPWSPPRHRIFYQNATLARYNPEGFQNRFELGYRYRLYDSDELLWRDSHLGVAFKPMITPAFTKLSIAAQAQPIAVLRLEAIAHMVGYYGVLGHPRPIDSPTEDVSDRANDAFAEDNQPESTWCFEADLIAELRAKVGPVIMRSTTLLRYTSFLDAANQSTYFYDPLDDMIKARQGWSLTNNTDVLVNLLSDHLIVGMRYSLAHALYEQHPERAAQQRIGPLVAYKFFMKPGERIDSPMLFLLVQWHLTHPHRTGQDVHQGVPYGVLGVSFQGDLLTPEKP